MDREGRDALKGQAGGDTFVFDCAIRSHNVDRIIDFNVTEANEGDTLMMRLPVFGLSPEAFSDSAFVPGTAAQDANDCFVFDQVAG